MTKKTTTIIMAAIAVIVTLEPGASALAKCGACKPIWDRAKPHVNVGTIGHIDHTKTLVRRNVQLKGFGSFSTTQRKARQSHPRTYAMRMKMMQIPSQREKSRKNDIRFFKSKAGHLIMSGSTAASTSHDLTPEEYRARWQLSSE